MCMSIQLWHTIIEEDYAAEEVDLLAQGKSLEAAN